MSSSSLNEVLCMKKFFVTFLLIMAVAITSTVQAAEFEMVEYSAQVKLQWLTEAGIPDAKKFLGLLNRPVFFNADNLKDFERIKLVNSLYQELNYAAAIEYVREKDYRNVFDLACSLSPRAMTLGNDGRRVVVGELQAVCLIGDYCVDEFGDKAKVTVDYDAFWLQDKELMMKSADKFTGPVCIIEQGVSIYLSDEIRSQMFYNIRDVLKKHGGCLITSDFVQKKYFTDAATALFGANEAPTLYNETKAMYEKVFDDKLADDALQNEQDAMAYLKLHGLRAEKIPLFKNTPQLYISSQLTPEQIKRVNELATKNYLWVITAI